MDQVFMTKYFDFESESEMLNDRDLEDQKDENVQLTFASESEFY